MTEPKVVHEWEEDEGQYQIRDTDAGPMLWVVRHSLKSPCQFIKELARLAARVQELEDFKGLVAHVDSVIIEELRSDFNRSVDENTRLREALAEYGHHKGGCDFAPCSCGILDALKEKP